MKYLKIFIVVILSICAVTCNGKEQKQDNNIELKESVVKPQVGLFNGCGIDGVAVSLGEKLIDDGYKLSVVDNWTDYEGNPRFYFNRTVVFYNKEVYKEEAKGLSDLIGVKVVDFRDDLYKDELDIGIIIGKDFDKDENYVLLDDDYEIPDEAWVVTGFPPESMEDGLYVSKKYHTVTLFKDGEIFRQYPCATGVDYSTPEGEFSVTVKLVDPVWHWEGKAIQPGPDNGLGTRFLGISKRSYGIHGTNEPHSIGRDASHGCVRMYNRDVEELYEYVEVGDVVKIGP